MPRYGRRHVFLRCRPGRCRSRRVKKEQYLWLYGLSFLWRFLDEFLHGTGCPSVAPSPTGINHKATQAMVFLVVLYTTVLWICTFKMHLTINLLFGFLATTLFILCAGVEHETVDKVGGYFGLFTAFLGPCTLLQLNLSMQSWETTEESFH